MADAPDDITARAGKFEREFKPLLQIKDNYPKYVLSMNTLFGSDHEGILRRNLIDFLLESD